MAERRRRDYDSYGVPTAAIFVGGVAAKNLAALGETRPSKALALADKLRRSGASPDTIHAETSKLLAGTPYAGVHYGRDGKPRFEVSDEGARVRKAGLDKSGRGFMGDFVEHPELYKALPEAQLLGVEKANFRGGGYDGRTIHIGDNNFAAAKLAGRPLARDSARGVALHELQHYAQDAEGFAPGASPDDFHGRFPGDANRALREEIYRTTAGEVEAENTRARRNMTAAQRRAAAPSTTETVPVSEQHLGVGEGRGMARQFGGDLPKGYTAERYTDNIGRTTYTIKKGSKRVGEAYVRDLGDKVQVGRIAIDDAHQRKGISTALYARIERDLGKPVVPDGMLSAKAFAFWKKHRPQSVAAYKALRDGGAMDDPHGYAKSLYADSESSAPETGGARTGVRRIQRMVEKSPSAGRKPRAPRASKTAKPITDLGEKIGGARKDIAVKTGPRKPRATVVDTDPRPAWQRRFVAVPELDRATKKPSGTWSLIDKETNSKWGGKTIRRGLASEQAALDVIPLAAVAQKHRVSSAPQGQQGYAIWRDVTDRKRVQIGTEVFPTREAALEHMAKHAVSIIETKTGFGEEILAPPKPDQVFRRGPTVRKGDVVGDQFIKTFGFRGVEFGNWNNQLERQRVMNHAYDAMRDLAEMTGLAPKAMSLDGKLGLAFGARGHGLAGARAHYERNYGTINLTKMQGAGSLAHEWMHALDHYLARKDDPTLDVMTTNKAGHKVFPADARAEDFASHRVSGYVRTKALAEEVRASMKSLMDTMYYKEEQYVDDAAKVAKFADYPKQRLAEGLADIRRDLARERTYGSRFTKPATAAQLAEFDALAAKILSGDAAALEIDTKMVPSKSVWSGGVKVHRSNPTLDGISAIMKKVRGRAGFSSDQRGPLDQLRATMASWKDRQAVVADAAAQTVKTRKIPTDFSMNAKRLDAGRVSDYWQTRHEMAARGFSAFIEDKVTALGRESGFLSYGSHNNRPEFRLLGAKPFPEGAERTAINAQFETLFAAMKRAGVLPAAPEGGAAPPVGGGQVAAAAAAETSGLRGTQNPNNLAAIVENRQASAKPETPSRLANYPKTGTHDIDVRGVTTEYRADAKGDPFKFKSRTFQNVGYGDDGYPKAAILHANTLEEYESKVAAAQKAMQDGAAEAADQKRADERFKQVLDDTERKVATAKAGSSAAPKEQPDLAKAANAKLPRGYGVYSRARAAGLSHDAALAQTAETLAKTTDRKFSGHADADGLRAAYEQAHTDSTSHAAARTKATKLARPSSVAIAKFEYDPERVQRFKQAFPKAKFNPTTKEWSVAGVTAQKRIDKWVALDADATAKTVLAEAKARDAAAFDGIKVNHPYVTAGKTGYAVRTPYDPALVKILKGLPGARWNPATKAWDVPMRSADALNARLPDIEKIAAPMVAREQEVQRQRQAQRDAQRVQWDKEKAAQKAKWTEQRAAEDARMAQVRSNRYLELSARNPKVGDTIRIGGKAVTVESIGKMFRADESTSSVSRLIGVEGEWVNYVYHRAATAAEVATLESVEAAAKAAAQARKVQADALGAMRDVFRSQGEMPAKMDTLPTGRAILSQGNHNRIYGGGEDYILRGKSLYQVMGNSADGDDWSRSNAPGSIVKKVSVTPDLLATMRAATGTPAKGIGFQNEANLNAALLAQGKSEVGKAQSRAVSRTEFMAAARATPLPGGGYEVTAPDGNKVALPNAGTETAAKITAFATLGSTLNKIGAVSMIAAPAAAAYVAYQSTRTPAMADDGTVKTGSMGAAAANAALAGGTTAAVGYGAMKAIGAAMGAAVKIAPKVAPALGPVGVGLAVAGMGYGAYQGYQRHGIKGAALGAIGADGFLDAPAVPPVAPVQGRLNAEQQQQFATANAAYQGMQQANAAKTAADGMTDAYTRTVNGQTVEVRAYKTPKR